MFRPTATECKCTSKSTCFYCLNKMRKGATSSALATNLQRDSRHESKAESSKLVPSKRPPEKNKPEKKQTSEKPSRPEASSSESAMPAKSRHDESSTRSTFTTKLDLDMAKRQTSIKTLPPVEQEKQEKWAQTQLQKNESKNCPAGLTWIRIKDGYRCLGGSHIVTDRLLAGGKGGWYKFDSRDSKDGSERRRGPYYEPDPQYAQMSKEKKKEIRMVFFGKDKPTAKDKLWKS